MADQASNLTVSPSIPNQATMREVAFLAANRRLAAQTCSTPRPTRRSRRNPLVVRPPAFKREGSTESLPTSTPFVSTESERKRRDDIEVFGNILSTLEQGGGLPEAGVVKQPLSIEEEIVVVAEEAIKDGVVVVEEEEKEKEKITIVEQEETKIAVEEAREVEVVLITPDVAMDEVAREVQTEEAKKEELKAAEAEKDAGVRLKKEAEAEKEDKKKKKSKGHKDGKEDEEAKKKKKEEKEKRKLCQKEKRNLREEEKAKQRATSLEKDGELTSVVRDFYRGRLHGNKDAVTFRGTIVLFSAREINKLYQMRENPDAPGNTIIDDP
ncbi:chromatin assembly factor 1 subunit A-like [Benincasa hispida]|uniref:chromatin assembly factor 1 subunit A-like n=1 Tax=Benincasa hispida TaxID=102211 RepID=UPI001902AD15|nr:chromatin assembly factor 1 subunit A-like [Benincasa hispida]